MSLIFLLSRSPSYCNTSSCFCTEIDALILVISSCIFLNNISVRIAKRSLLRSYIERRCLLRPKCWCYYEKCQGILDVTYEGQFPVPNLYTTCPVTRQDACCMYIESTMIDSQVRGPTRQPGGWYMDSVRCRGQGGLQYYIEASMGIGSSRFIPPSKTN